MALRSISDDRKFGLAVAGVLAIGAVLRILAFTIWDIHHADEFTQYLEQGHRLAEGYGLIPWENRYGIRNALIPQFLAGWFAIGDAIAPGGLLPLILARLGFAMLCASALWGAWAIGRARSREHALIALTVAACWYEAVLYGAQLLSESAATALAVCAAGLLLSDGGRPRRTALAGLLLGLAVLVRLQYAVFAVVLVVPLLAAEWRRWRWLIAGGIGAMVLGGLSDLIDHRVPFAWISANFQMNIAAGRAAMFGTTGPLGYVGMLLVSLGPLAPLLAVGTVLAGRPYRALAAAAFANVIVHSLIGHKEDRFIWLSAFLIVILAAIASLDLLMRWHNRRGTERPLPLAAILALALAWLSYSALAETISGGARTFRGGGVIPHTAYALAHRPEACGLIVPEQWRNHVVTAFLRRDIPLYVAPNALLDHTEPLPSSLASAANALLADRPLAGMEGWHQSECRAKGPLKACLFVRPGPCNRAAGMPWDYQRRLLDSDL